MSGLAAENVQARLRMVALMALSNSGGQMLLTTGNKSEMSVGYATLYGDMAGGYSVLKDAYKTTVFALSRWRNANKPEGALGPDGPVMPARVITKPPTAELRPDQKDEDSLPPYSVLDRILEGLVDKEMSVGEVANATGEDVALVADIESKLLKAEYKRRQAPPGVKIGNAQFRPRPPLSDQQFLPHRPEGEDCRDERRHPLRAVADRPAARRQYPHGAAQLPVRAEERRHVHPADRRHRPRALDRRVRPGDPRRSRLAGPHARPDGPPVGAVRPLRARVRAAEGRRAGSMPATKRPRSSSFAARCCSGAGCRRSTSASPPMRRCRKAARRTGASGSTMTRRSSGTTSSAASSASIPKLLSDPVVRREDGSWLYLLPSVIDDVDLGVTHVVRGEDHVSNSAAQIQMFEALGREAAALRARGVAGRRRGQVVEAARLLRRRASARRRRRADGAARRARADRHVAAGRAGRIARRARRRASTSRPSAARRRISIRTRSSWSMPGCSTSSIMPRSPTGCRPARPRRTGCCFAATSSGWRTSPPGSRCSTARSSRPSSAMRSGCW